MLFRFLREVKIASTSLPLFFWLLTEAVEKEIGLKSFKINLITLTAREDDEFPSFYQQGKNNFSPHFSDKTSENLLWIPKIEDK